MDTFSHEKLHVYQKSLRFVALAEQLLQDRDGKYAVCDHLARASESMVVNLVEGNSRWSSDGRGRYFDYAFGSSLECAACLDVGRVRELVSDGTCREAKEGVAEITMMLVGLRRSQPTSVQEPQTRYETRNRRQAQQVLFPHETLDVYQTALEFVKWFHEFSAMGKLPARRDREIDKVTTSFVLNIAEGNGRFSVVDQCRFLRIAERAALRAAAFLDLATVREEATPKDVQPGKKLLPRIVSMLHGMMRVASRPASSQPMEYPLTEESWS